MLERQQGLMARVLLSLVSSCPQAEYVCGPLLEKWSDAFITNDTLNVGGPLVSRPCPPRRFIPLSNHGYVRARRGLS